MADDGTGGQAAPRTTFTTTVQSAGGTKAGIEVPDEVLEALGGGRRVPVLVTVGAHTWASTTAVMGGRTLLGMSTENRRLAGIEPGQQVEVPSSARGPREVAVPDDLAAALAADPACARPSTRSPPATARTTSCRSRGPRPRPRVRSGCRRCSTACAAERSPAPSSRLRGPPSGRVRPGTGTPLDTPGAPVTTRVAGAPSGVRQTRLRRPAMAR